MASYNPHSSWQYRNQTYDSDSTSDSDYGNGDWYEQEDDDDDWYEEEEEEEDDDNDDDDEEEEEEEEEEEDDDNLIVTEVLEKHLPETWSEMEENTEVELVPLDRFCPEFQDIVNIIRSTLKVYIHRIERVQNPFLWGSYLLMKGEYRKKLKKSLCELKLFHATGQKNIQSIVENNFDWRRTVRSKFGKGVSFSPSAKYANEYCNIEAGTYRALILTRILVGKCQIGKNKTYIPDCDYDTTIGNGKKVYVKYGDNEYYPEYVAYYKYHD